ncbi:MULTISPECIES: hypothetical protein [unclassified Knoellia]|uniref:hypothetical protein n=1 Tax=Knoellia altitudinis TaxID=3404795 RepID=UPI00361BAC93
MTERDPYWQARDGLERWSGAPLARADTWSWAQPDGIFRPTSPAWNTALGLGHDGFGVAGIALIGALGMAAYFVVAILVSRRLGARALPTLATTALVALLALPMVSPRATIVIEAMLLLTLLLGHALITRPLPRQWWAFAGAAAAGAALGWAGAWLHVSWSVTALGLAAGLPLLAVLAGASRWRVGLAATLGSGLAVGSLLGPFRWSVWQLLADIGSASGGQVVEWLSPFTGGLRLRWLPVASLCLVLVAVCAVRLLRHRTGARGSAERARWALEVLLVVIALLATLAGLIAIRFLGVAALTLLPVLAAELSEATVRWRARPSMPATVRTRLTAGYWRPILTGVAVLLLPLAVVASNAPGRPSPAAEVVDGLPPSCRLFTDPDTAGVALLLRPDVKVWIDMRTEVYGAAAYSQVRERLLSSTAVSLPEGATCAVVPTTASTVHVDASPDAPWTRSTTREGLSVWLP